VKFIARNLQQSFDVISVASKETSFRRYIQAGNVIVIFVGFEVLTVVVTLSN
jgi:hypothetical protein